MFSDTFLTIPITNYKRICLMRFLLPVVFALTLIGCAQKLPTNAGNDLGIIAIPVKASSDRNNEYFYYYKIYSDLDDAEPITVYPEQGEFAFSAPLPPGKYLLESYDVIANNNVRTYTSIAKDTKSISHLVKVDANRVTVLSYRFEVECKRQAEDHYYRTYSNFMSMTEAERLDYVEKLRAQKNGGQWVIN